LEKAQACYKGSKVDGSFTVKVLGHVFVGLNAVVGRMECWDGLCEWTGCGPGPCMLICLDYGDVCY
jgi:hypothetical protein